MEIIRKRLKEARSYLDILGKEGIIFSDGRSSLSKCYVYKFENLYPDEIIDEKIIFPKKKKP